MIQSGSINLSPPGQNLRARRRSHCFWRPRESAVAPKEIRKPRMLIQNLAKLTTGDTKDYVRCIASRMCEGSWTGQRNRARLLNHIKDCAYLPQNMILTAMEEVAKGRSGGLELPKFVDEIQMEVDHARGEEEASDDEKGSDGKHKPEAGRSAASNVTKSHSQPSVQAVAQAAGSKAFKEKVDETLTEVLCGCSLSSTLVDNDKFKRFCALLSNKYTLPSSSTVDKKLIPIAAARIQLTTTKYLASCRDMTISFDGGKIRRPQAIYTFHITTSQRRSFLKSMDDASRLSHTANYIAERLDSVSTYH